MPHKDYPFWELIDSNKILEQIFSEMEAAVDISNQYREDERVKKLAFKSLFIELCSFIDELDFMYSTIYRMEVFNHKINRFLLTTHFARAVFNKFKKELKLFRNTFFAHNRRDKGGRYANYSMIVLQKMEEAPISYDELYTLFRLCNVVRLQLHNCLREENSLAFSHMTQESILIRDNIGKIYKRKNLIRGEIVEEIQAEIRLVEDSLKNTDDNYKIISNIIRCEIVPKQKIRK